MHANSDHETQISLAPAAGSGIGRLLAAALLAKPDLISGMCDVIDRGFTAAKKFWDPSEKCWVTEPDSRTQIQTLALVLAHMEGEPVKRIIHQHLGAGGKLDPLAALQESPELLEGMKDLIQKAEWKKSGHQAHKRPKKVAAITPAAVEIEPE